MNHGIGLIFGKDRVDRGDVANVVLFENIAIMRCNRRERRKISRVGQLVDDNDFIFQVCNEMTANSRSNEASTSRHEYAHLSISY